MIDLDCLFCKIGKDEIPSYTIYEDDIVKAFLDIHPKSNGHILIVPKKHVHDFMGLEDATLLHIHEVAKKITKLLEEKLQITGLSLTTNYLDLQEIKHFHLHLVPKNNEKLKEVPDIYAILKQ